MSFPAKPGAIAGSAQASPFQDPLWFADIFDARRGEVSFVAADRASVAAQNFLDWRWDHRGAAIRRENAGALIADLPRESPSLAIIWHTGFCCSTLLAKALDRPGRNLALCEPQILVHAADAKRSRLLQSEPLSLAPKLLFHLLSRPFAPGERVTVKPAPAANALLREAAIQTFGQMLFLYSDCRSFVISVYRLGEQGRKYVRGLFLALLADGHPQAGWPVQKLLALSDLELAAMVWHMQMAEFHRAWTLLGDCRAASLDCDALLSAPIETLCRVDEFFSLGLGQKHFVEAVEGPLFRRNAKTNEEGFDATRRRDEHARIASTLAPHLDRIIAESYETCTATLRDVPLPKPLVPIHKEYFVDA